MVNNNIIGGFSPIVLKKRMALFKYGIIKKYIIPNNNYHRNIRKEMTK